MKQKFQKSKTKNCIVMAGLIVLVSGCLGGRPISDQKIMSSIESAKSCASQIERKPEYRMITPKIGSSFRQFQIQETPSSAEINLLTSFFDETERCRAIQTRGVAQDAAPQLASVYNLHSRQKRLLINLFLEGETTYGAFNKAYDEASDELAMEWDRVRQGLMSDYYARRSEALSNIGNQLRTQGTYNHQPLPVTTNCFVMKKVISCRSF